MYEKNSTPFVDSGAYKTSSVQTILTVYHSHLIFETPYFVLTFHSTILKVQPYEGSDAGAVQLCLAVQRFYV